MVQAANKRLVTEAALAVSLANVPSDAELALKANSSAVSNVDNTSDVNKPVSDVQAQALIPAYVVADVDATGVTDCTVAIQARVDAARDDASGFGRVVVPAGRYAISGAGIVIPKGVDFVCDDQALFTYTGSGIAFTVDNFNELNATRPSDGGGFVKIGRLRRATRTWATGVDTTSVGLKIINTNWTRIEIAECMNFNAGVLMVGDGFGTSYNQIYLGRITNNKRNLCDLVLPGGWVNGNNFIGGAIRHDTGISSYVGTRGIDFQWGNGNTFTGINLENSTTERTISFNSTSNILTNCRFELAKMLHFGPNSYGNQVLGGYNIGGPNQRIAAPYHITYTAAGTASSTTLTSSTAVWTAGDVGKSISVFDAGPTILIAPTRRAPLHTTIAAFVDANTVTLTDPLAGTITASRQITRRSTNLVVEVMDDSSLNIVFGDRGQVAYVGNPDLYGGDAAYTAWSINSGSDVAYRVRNSAGATLTELDASGRSSHYGGTGKKVGSTTTFATLKVDPTTSSVMGRAAFTAGRGVSEPDVGLSRVAGNQIGWESNAPFVKKVLAATQATATVSSFNVSTGDVFVLTLAANCTGLILQTPAQAGQVIILEIVQGGVGSFTWVAPATMKFAGGVKPASSTAVGSRDTYVMRWDGTNWLEVSRSLNVS